MLHLKNPPVYKSGSTFNIYFHECPLIISQVPLVGLEISLSFPGDAGLAALMPAPATEQSRGLGIRFWVTPRKSPSPNHPAVEGRVLPRAGAGPRWSQAATPGSSCTAGGEGPAQAKLPPSKGRSRQEGWSRVTGSELSPGRSSRSLEPGWSLSGPALLSPLVGQLVGRSRGGVSPSSR